LLFCHLLQVSRFQAFLLVREQFHLLTMDILFDVSANGSKKPEKPEKPGPVVAPSILGEEIRTQAGRPTIGPSGVQTRG
jgi:hypothetical protein